MKLLILFFASFFTAHAQVCVPVPTPGSTITQSTLDELKKRGVLAPGVSAFASLEAFAMAFGGSLPYIPQSASNQKFWADFTPGADYVTVEGALDTSDVATWSEWSMTVYGSTVARFYRDRATAKDPVFARIPRFKRFSSAQPGDMNMTSGVGKPGPRTVTASEAQYPLARYRADATGDGGKSWSYAQNHILRFHPVTGQVEACDYQDYERTFPLVYKVDPPGGSAAAGAIRVKNLSDEAFLAAVGAALFGGGTPAERVAAILKNLEVR